VPSPFEAHLLLCDAAQTDPNGKIHMLGAGWSTIGSPMGPTAVAALINVPWDRTNEKIALELVLLSDDGQLVQLPGPMGDQPLQVTSEIEVGRPPGVLVGTPIPFPFSMNVGPLPLSPGRYEWRLTLNGESFSAPFTVVAIPGRQVPAAPPPS